MNSRICPSKATEKPLGLTNVVNVTQPTSDARPEIVTIVHCIVCIIRPLRTAQPFCESRKGAYGSGAEKEVTPLEL